MRDKGTHTGQSDAYIRKRKPNLEEARIEAKRHKSEQGKQIKSEQEEVKNYDKIFAKLLFIDHLQWEEKKRNALQRQLKLAGHELRKGDGGRVHVMVSKKNTNSISHGTSWNFPTRASSSRQVPEEIYSGAFAGATLDFLFNYSFSENLSFY